MAIAKISYRTYFGECPSRTAGALTLKLVDEFDKTKSLKKIKEKILEEGLEEKHFLASYNIRYNPISKIVKFSYDCSRPIMRVQVYKDMKNDPYDAVLVENGKLLDPIYEEILRQEGKLTFKLPILSMPVEFLDSKIQYKLAQKINILSSPVKVNIAEVILDRSEQLTMIFSFQDRPVTVFLGKENWSGKLRKLEKIVSFMNSKKKMPSVINLLNNKKVVVKFGDSF